MTELKIKGRIFVSIPIDEASAGDVVEYFDHGTRWRPVTARRGGANAGVRVKDAVGRVRWVPLRSVKSAWRWHRKQQASLF